MATATRDGRRLIAVVLGAPSAAVRAEQAAQLLEQGFTAQPLSWLTPSLGLVSSLTPVEAEPANLHEEMCGPHRKRPAAEEEEQEATNTADSPSSLFLSSLKPQPKGASLLQADATLGEPVVVFTGPPRGQGAAAATQTADAKPGKKAAIAKGSLTPTATPAAPANPPVATASTVPWTSMSPAALAASPPTELGAPPAQRTALVPLPRPRPRLPAMTAEKPPSH